MSRGCPLCGGPIKVAQVIPRFGMMKQEQAALFLSENPQFWVGKDIRRIPGEGFALTVMWKAVIKLLKREGIYASTTGPWDIRLEKIIKMAEELRRNKS